MLAKREAQFSVTKASKMLGFSESCSRCVPQVFLQIALLKQFAAISRGRFRKFLGVGTPPIFPAFAAAI
jgi:hypothetical protein